MQRVKLKPRPNNNVNNHVNRKHVIKKDPHTGQFVQGNIGGGRPLGSRNRLTEEFLADLHHAWQRHGVAALEAAATKSPVKFCQLVASLLPAKLVADVSLGIKPIEIIMPPFPAGGTMRTIEHDVTDREAAVRKAIRGDQH